jgi:pimeloyl-ACP methyl ester carboxylesterase
VHLPSGQKEFDMASLTAKRRSGRDQVTEYIRAGHGSPTIILINGAGGPVEAWYRLMPELVRLGTVFAYNRPGVGESDKPRHPQTGTVMAADLHSLLRSEGIPGPYILVAHSLGGLIANLFARHYPHDVAGVVMLDATAPEDPAAMQAAKGAFARLLEKLTGYQRDPLGETAHVAQTVAQIGAAGPFPDVPLAVVSGARPAMGWLTPAAARAARAEHQRRMAALSSRGKHILARKSGHFPQFSEPALVLDAVRQVIAMARSTV